MIKEFIPINKTIWTIEMVDYLMANFYKKTNPELAKDLGLRLTVTRNKCNELGLRRIEMEYWTTEQVEYLKANYTIKGDVEIAELFEQMWPKKKKWTKNHISKKRGYLKLKRTEEQYQLIASKNSKPGGKSFTILKNSSSINTHDSWVAARIAWRNKDLQKEVLKNPNLIAAARQVILLKRKVKEFEKNKHL